MVGGGSTIGGPRGLTRLYLYSSRLHPPLLAGGYSWGPGRIPVQSRTPSSTHDRLGGLGDDEAQQTAALIAGALGSLLTPLFLRAILTFLIWWTAACQLLSSLFGLYFQRHLAGS